MNTNNNIFTHILKSELQIRPLCSTDDGYIDPAIMNNIKYDSTLETVIETYFTCDICLGILYPPVTFPCGHTFCKDCINKLCDIQMYSKLYKCSLCQKNYFSGLIEEIKLKQFIEDHVIVYCCYNCGWSGNICLYKTHIEDCDNKLLICECGEKIIKKDYETHKENCLHKIIQCEYCFKYGKQKDLENHKLMCPARPILCISCNQLFPFDTYLTHKQSHIPKRIPPPPILTQMLTKTKKCETCNKNIHIDHFRSHSIICQNLSF